MQNDRPRISLRTVLGFATSLLLVACSLDDNVQIIKVTTTGGGMDGGSTTTSTSTTTAGSGGATTSAAGTGGTTTSGSGGAASGSGGKSAAGGAGGAATTAGTGGTPAGTGGTPAGTGGTPAGTGGTPAGAGGTPAGAGGAPTGAGGDTGGAGAGGDPGSGGGGAGGDTGGGGGGGGPVGPIKNPTGISVSGMNATTEQHPSVGGTMFTDICGTDEVLIGFDGTMDSATDSARPWLKSATGICGKLALGGTGPYTVSIMASGALLTPRGSMSDKMMTAHCPPNKLIVGFSGKAGTYIDSLSFDCASLNVTGDSTNGYTLVVDSNVTTVGPIGGSGGIVFGPYTCNMGEVVNGTSVHSGDWFDGFGLTCGAIALTGTRLRP